MTRRVRITDVAPRDGLQNEPGLIAAADKARLVTLLARAGVDEIEVSSFVSPRWVPQLADAAEVFRLLAEQFPVAGRMGMPILSALVPNEKGLEGALSVNRAAGRPLIGKVAVFTAASETFSRRNTNASIGESLERIRPVIAGARAHGLAVRGYVSCVIACPFEGPIGAEGVARVAASLIELGADEIDLGDTIGAGTAESVRALLRACLRVAPPEGSVPTTLHLHDTHGRAAECVRAGLEMGIRSFDGSVAGLGGCPYAGTPGRPAPGNIATELLVQTVEEEGFATGVDREALASASAFARQVVSAGRAVGS
jgi:hydroxymethylglutaryl-CoA lyase